jgi:hypothetical protein
LAFADRYRKTHFSLIGIIRYFLSNTFADFVHFLTEVYAAQNTSFFVPGLIISPNSLASRNYNSLGWQRQLLVKERVEEVHIFVDIDAAWLRSQFRQHIPAGSAKAPDGC